MVGAFEQAVLAAMMFVIMLGMGASLTPRDFVLSLKKPQGMAIGLVSQYGIMPFVAFTLAVLLPVSMEVKIGILIMGCMPGGTTSNIFTYFAKGNLALSILMTVNSTVFGVIMIPLLLVGYLALMQSLGFDVQIPRENVIATLILLLVPAAIGVALRKWNANWGAVTEFVGSALGVIFILLLLISWVPRNWEFLMSTGWGTYAGAIGLGLIGFVLGYVFSILLKQSPRDARTISLEIAIQNGPLALAIVIFTFSGTRQQEIVAVPALYSLFIVLTATAVTFLYRNAEDRAAQKSPKALL